VKAEVDQGSLSPVEFGKSVIAETTPTTSGGEQEYETLLDRVIRICDQCVTPRKIAKGRLDLELSVSGTAVSIAS
jgi:hypothetical protein